MNTDAFERDEERRGVISRRSFVSQSFLGAGVCLLRGPRSGITNLLDRSTSFHEGVQLGVVPFVDEGTPPFGRAMGSELDGRLFSDLSSISPEKSVTSTNNFYVRTRVSKLLPHTDSWRIRVGGVSIPARDLHAMARPMGVHLMECAGNSRAASFGLLSVAEWTGVPLLEVLEDAQTKLHDCVLVSGFDQYSASSRTSIPGASWIVTAAQLSSSHAFLATQMNTQPLTADHGAPVRLVMPGWYGCACIKWVNEIQPVPDDAPATSQMQEYASRTMQNGTPALAADYQPAWIDLAAMPVRIEKWSVAGRIKYRIIGIQWGGNPPIESLLIRFNPGDDYVAVDDFRSSTTDSWSIWTHTWTPSKPGKYVIRLGVGAPKVVTRRLDLGYYDRAVEIGEM